MPAVGYDFLLPYYADAANGWQDVVTPANPSAGASFVRTVPGETVEILLNVEYSLVTSATVATRLPFVVIQNERGQSIASAFPTAGQTAGTAQSYRFTVQVTALSPAGAVQPVTPLFPFALLPSYSINIGAQSLQAGDTFLGIALVLQRYWTGPVLAASPDVVLSPGALPAAVLESFGAASVGAASTPASAATQPATAAPRTAAEAATQAALTHDYGTQTAAPAPALTPIPGAATILRE